MSTAPGLAARLGALLARTPTGRALAFALRGREKPTLALLGVVLTYALLTASVPLSPRMRESVIAVAHFRPRSLASWVVLQPLPKMYVHENRVLVSPHPPPGGAASDTSRRKFEADAFWVNHYPARIGRFDGSRRLVFGAPPYARYLVLETRYRGTVETTTLVARIDRGRLLLEPYEVAP